MGAPAAGRIRLGLSLGDYPLPPEGPGRLFDRVVDQVRAAERSGFDSVWVPDHLMQTPVVAPKEDPMFECYTTLGALAALTSRVRLGAFVGCAAYRHPGLLAKAVTTLDLISHGRAVFGIGAGWYEEEHRAYGYDFGTTTERFERLEEVLQIVRPMLRGETPYVEGRHFRVAGPLNCPPPEQAGGPPVLIGGSGEKRTLRLVARYADICNVSGGPAKIRHLMDVLDRHCEEEGRDPAEIGRTFINVVIVRPTEREAVAAMPEAYRHLSREVTDHLSETVRPFCGTRSQVVDQIGACLAAGVDGMVLSCAGEDRTADYVELLADLAGEVLS
jgi:F420-dependent oxidoreductase-like protein